MSLNETVSAERPHIGFFGLRNAGKSSLVNAVTGQELSVVSEIRGTTTDPVKKAMELLPLGPVVIIDTPGLDDEGALGEQRVRKARQILAKTDIAVLVVDAVRGLTQADRDLQNLFEERKLPYVIALTKADLLPEPPAPQEHALCCSAVTGAGIHELKETLGSFALRPKPRPILADLLPEGGTAILVMPIDESALKNPPDLVVTDSQAFGRVSRDVPESIPLTSFSILFARYKGNLETLVRGAAKLSGLKDGDRVLISEGCTHHRQCNDIGTVKIPGWVRQFSGASPEFSFTSGGDFPEDLSPYALIIHCGGCMLNETEMKHRIARAETAGVPIVNYGVAIAQMHGILRRSLQPFPEVLALLDPETL